MTTFEITIKETKTTSYFEPEDFLAEAILEFLESGKETNKLASSIVKAAIGIELLIKDKLEEICPALILEKLSDNALELIKVLQLEKALLDPSLANNVKIKTVNFETLVTRAEYVIKELKHNKFSLIELHKIRNELIHHKTVLEVPKINLLLIKIFKFSKALIKDPFGIWSDKSIWGSLEKIEKASSTALLAELQKKLAHHMTIAATLNTSELKNLIKSKVRTSDFEVIDTSDLICPSCKKPTLTSFYGVDYDWSPDGENINSYRFMRCRICKLDLDEEEIEYIQSNYEIFQDNNEIAESWKYVFEPESYDGYDYERDDDS